MLDISKYMSADINMQKKKDCGAIMRSTHHILVCVNGLYQAQKYNRHSYWFYIYVYLDKFLSKKLFIFNFRFKSFSYLLLHYI